MICPMCGYMMDAFDKECARCHGKGIPKPAAPPPAQASPAPPPAPAAPPPPAPTPRPQAVMPLQAPLPVPQTQMAPGGLVKCPFCSEGIQPNAQKCRFCGEWLGTNAPQSIVPGLPGNHVMVPMQAPRGVGLALPQPKPVQLHSIFEYQTWPQWAQIGVPAWGAIALIWCMMQPDAAFVILVNMIGWPALAAYFINRSRIRQQITAIFGNSEGFSASQRYLAHWNYSGIALDQRSNQLSLINVRHNYVHQTYLAPQDIVACEVVEDNHSSVTQDSGCALAGCLFFGLPGLLVGALAGPKRTTGRVRRIDLKITVNDINKPHYVVNFLRGDTSHGSFMYKGARDQADHWLALINVLKKHG